MLSIDQLFVFLVCLKNGLNLDFTSWLFDANKSYFYFSLGVIPIWPTKDQIRQSIPDSFKNTYPNTRCILDCIELFYLSPPSGKAQSRCIHFIKTMSHRDISPFGALIFISQLYDASISDKEIVAGSSILDSRFWKEGDSCMGDSRFAVADDLKSLIIELNIPAFLSGRDQLTKAEIKESQSISSVCIHVERAIRRLTSRLIRNEILLVFHGLINQL